MENQAIAAEIVKWMAPFLPYLIKGGIEAGKGAAKKLGEKFSEETWEKAESLWVKLKPKLETRPAAKEAIQDVEKDPQDEDILAALRVQVRKIIEENSDLAELAQSYKKEADSTQQVEINQKAGAHSNQFGIVHGDVHIKPKSE